MDNFIVDLSTLPKHILSKIPYSIRVSKSKYNINELPLNIQYLVNDYISNSDLETIYDENTYDFIPFASEYNDLKPIKDKRQLVLEYLKNYLSIKTNSYPFDINFGCNLKSQLQTKDTSLRQTLVSNEISLILDVLGNDYNINIIGKSLKFERKQYVDKTEYSCQLVVQIDMKEFLITVE
jgi:hypothetical protein